MLNLTIFFQIGCVVDDLNPNTLQRQIYIPVSSRPTWSTQWVPGPHIERSCPPKKTSKRKQNKKTNNKTLLLKFKIGGWEGYRWRLRYIKEKRTFYEGYFFFCFSFFETGFSTSAFQVLGLEAWTTIHSLRKTVLTSAIQVWGKEH